MTLTLSPLTQPLHYDGDDLFLVEGTLTELQTSRTTVNLLAQLDKRAQAKNLATGVAAAVGDMHGQLANSAMLALYDGEDMYNFAGLLGEQVVCGTFERGDAFQSGDTIKAVVSKRGDVLKAHAVLRERDQMLFMPLSCVRGDKAHFWSCMRHARNSCIGVLLVSFSILAFLILNSDKQKNLADYWPLFALASIVPLMIFPMEYWTYRTTKYMGEHASAIFKVFGVPRADELDLMKAMHYKYPEDETGVNGAFNFKKALDLHAKRLGLAQ
jgi:hypothetical protein